MNIINLGIKLREGDKFFACFLMKSIVLRSSESHYVAVIYVSDLFKKKPQFLFLIYFSYFKCF